MLSKHPPSRPWTRSRNAAPTHALTESATRRRSPSTAPGTTRSTARRSARRTATTCAARPRRRCRSGHVGPPPRSTTSTIASGTSRVRSVPSPSDARRTRSASWSWHAAEIGAGGPVTRTPRTPSAETRTVAIRRRSVAAPRSTTPRTKRRSRPVGARRTRPTANRSVPRRRLRERSAELNVVPACRHGR